ncbi:unnamed protein product [Caenorhabditis auriculariae]|uniref:Uncharacterized protein n=1 Tax=Caenorhabditis auriculariae TaxID=2777116 RepID=A0A8S1HW18_9PELO|nr:unnamed protein product [Caenorhabditis auriculariae]
MPNLRSGSHLRRLSVCAFSPLREKSSLQSEFSLGATFRNTDLHPSALSSQRIRKGMGKLERIGRSLWKRLSGRKKKSKRDEEENIEKNSRTTDEVRSSSASSSDEETYKTSPDVVKQHEPTTSPQVHTVPRLYILAYLKLVEQNVRPPEPHEHEDIAKQLRGFSRQSKHSDDISGYATDDTILSSLNHIDTSREESLGYHSTSELSPREPYQHQKLGRQHHRPSFQSAADLAFVPHPMSRRSQDLLHRVPQLQTSLPERAATIDQLNSIEDPIDRFLCTSVYKTKIITTVFEANNGGLEDVYDDVVEEIDRWFTTKNMMAVACELHFSVPEKRRNRHLECRLKDKLLAALRENNKRLLYMKGMGRGKTPIKLAESKTEENITKDIPTDSVQGIYQRSYTRLLRYLHKETPEWHAPYWRLQVSPEQRRPAPERFLFGQANATRALASTTVVSLNLVGLSILGNHRRSCDLFF